MPDACWETLEPHTILFRKCQISVHCYRSVIADTSFILRHSHCGNLLFRIKDHNPFWWRQHEDEGMRKWRLKLHCSIFVLRTFGQNQNMKAHCGKFAEPDLTRFHGVSQNFPRLFSLLILMSEPTALLFWFSHTALINLIFRPQCTAGFNKMLGSKTNGSLPARRQSAD